MNIFKKKYDQISHTQLKLHINKLPKIQQEAVNACFNAVKFKSSRGRRLTTNWIYECLLMRIKSPKSYCKMRKDNILPLPSYTTLQRYIKKLYPTYGFSEVTFQIMGLKAKDMYEIERHGMHKKNLFYTLNFK